MEQRVPYEVPRGAALGDRLSSVLAVIYLIFNEGYAATAGEDWVRPALCEEALRLGRILAELAPQEPEVHGLVALMEIQASRLGARTSASGEPILLLDQNRARWDQLLIRRGLGALARAERLGAERGPYVMQAAIAACHARARSADATDWSRIAELYAELAARTPSPVIELNRAVAVSMAEGPQAGLALVDALTTEPTLKNYHLLPSVRGDFLKKLGRTAEARAEFERAASLTQNARERKLLLDRAPYAFSRVMTFVTLAALYCIARRVVGPRRALFLALVMMLYPLFHTKGERFNNYQVLLALLPLLVLTFLVAYEKRTALWGALLGLAAAACTLTIYSGLLGVAAIGLAALIHPERIRFLRSPVPWIAAIAYLVALTPHVLWLIKWNYPTLQWASSLAEQPGSVRHTLEYLGHHFALVAIPVVIGAALLWPWRRAVNEFAAKQPGAF